MKAVELGYLKKVVGVKSPYHSSRGFECLSPDNNSQYKLACARLGSRSQCESGRPLPRTGVHLAEIADESAICGTEG